jgi:glycerophosphoryl diester phosphodiesterase
MEGSQMNLPRFRRNLVGIVHSTNQVGGQSTTASRFRNLAILFGFLCQIGMGSTMAQPPIKVIAHRGASGYCHEHSEAAKALAHAQHADYIEQDVVLSKDQIFVVSHDITLNATTNVETVYPDRARKDKRHYIADFTWDELCRLELCARRELQSETPVGQRLMRLDNEIELLRHLDRAFQRQTGLYIELKGPSFHQQEFGTRMGDKLLALLQSKDVPTDPESCLIQCFESDELLYLSQKKCPYKLVQLLGDRSEFDFAKVARYAYGVGPSLGMLATSQQGKIASTGFVEKAKEAGLRVHPYTVRRDSQPKWSRSLDETHRFLIETLGVDGFFTDYPDLGRQAIQQSGSSE